MFCFFVHIDQPYEAQKQYQTTFEYQTK